MSQSIIGRLHASLGLDSTGFENGLNRSQAAAQRFRKQMIGLAGALGAAMGAALSVRGMIQAADTWSDLSSRVGLAVGDMERAPAVMQRIQQIARASYSDLGQTAEAFISNSTALRELGYSTGQTLDYTESLNNALVISGARGQRAESVQRALSTAMATGRLQGQGLNTVLANGGRVAEALAAELGTTVNGLREAASKGRITSDVIGRALLGNMEALRKEAADMPATIDDGMTAIRNSVTALIGTMDQTMGASEGFGNFLVAIGDNMQQIASYTLAAATALTASYIPALVRATVATGAWIAQMITLRGALIATGIGAFIVGAGTAINFLLDLVKKTGGWGEALKLLGDVAKGVWDGIQISAQALPHYLDAVWKDIESGFYGMMSRMLEMWTKLITRIAGNLRELSDVPVFGAPLRGAAGRLTSASGDAFGAMAEYDALQRAAERDASQSRRTAGGLIERGAAQAAEALQRLRDAMAATEDQAVDTDEVIRNIGSTSGSGGGRSKSGDTVIDKVRNEVQALRAELEVLQGLPLSYDDYSRAVERARKEAEMLQDMQNRGIAITPEIQAQVSELADRWHAVSEAIVAARSRHEEFRSALEQFRSTMESAFTGLIQGAHSLRSALSNIISALAQMAASRAFQYLWDGTGPKGSGGGLGSIVANIFKGIGLRADGGPVSAGRPYIIGERGPELFVPRVSGGIVPNHAIAAGGGGARIEVVLSPDLEARILEQSGAQAVQIVGGTVNRLRKQMPGQVLGTIRDPRRRG